MSDTKPTSPFRRVALIGGSGYLSDCFIKAFIEAKDEFEVTILTRMENLAATQERADGCSMLTVVGVDYDNEDQVREIFSKQEVVISLLLYQGLKLQETLIPIARAAGVKWFIPSEFGPDLHMAGTRKLQSYIDRRPSRMELERYGSREGMSYTYVIAGILVETFTDPSNEWIPDFHTVMVPDASTRVKYDRGQALTGQFEKGQVKNSFITCQDIAYCTLGVLRRFEKFANKCARVASFTASYDDWIAAFKTVKDVTYRPIYEPIEYLEQRIQRSLSDYDRDSNSSVIRRTIDQLRAAMAVGDGRIDVGSWKLDSNDMPEVSLTTLEEAVKNVPEYKP
ncbi:hypothetical protein GGI24_004870 [Coemansia furcata]|nr:hypothetical protein GGI24_004870 [Coemansia furcata]